MTFSVLWNLRTFQGWPWIQGRRRNPEICLFQIERSAVSEASARPLRAVTVDREWHGDNRLCLWCGRLARRGGGGRHVRQRPADFVDAGRSASDRLVPPIKYCGQLVRRPVDYQPSVVARQSPQLMMMMMMMTMMIWNVVAFVARLGWLHDHRWYSRLSRQPPPQRDHYCGAYDSTSIRRAFDGRLTKGH